MKRFIPHVIKEESREHVLWYDSFGVHCSESNCIINKELHEVKDLVLEGYKKTKDLIRKRFVKSN